MSEQEATSGDGTKMCGQLGNEATFLFGDGSTGTVIDWSSETESCTCNVEGGTLTKCNGGVIDNTQVACVWEEARCIPGLCGGCTAGAYGACPPSSNAYSAQCSEDSVTTCRSRANSPAAVDPQRSLLIYVRNLRIEYDVTCTDYNNGVRPSREEAVCGDPCP
jgi:hypothetical protein